MRRRRAIAKPSIQNQPPIRRTMGGYRKTMRYPQCYGNPYTKSEIQIFHAQRILLDEFAARFNHIAHQFGEQIIRFNHVIHTHLQ